METIIFLIGGLFFPVLSLLTCVMSYLDRWRYNKHSSPVFIPFIGPFLLTCWVLGTNKPCCLVPVVWIGDIGTMAFIWACPRFIGEWWQTSSFTRILTLRGREGNQRVVITLHSSGHYLLKKSWKRPPGEIGITSFGEPGTYVCKEDNYELTAHYGLHRILRKIDESTYRIEDESRKDEPSDYSLNGWLLKG